MHRVEVEEGGTMTKLSQWWNNAHSPQPPEPSLDTEALMEKVIAALRNVYGLNSKSVQRSMRRRNSSRRS